MMFLNALFGSSTFLSGDTQRARLNRLNKKSQVSPVPRQRLTMLRLNARTGSPAENKALQHWFNKTPKAPAQLDLYKPAHVGFSRSQIEHADAKLAELLNTGLTHFSLGQ